MRAAQQKGWGVMSISKVWLEDCLCNFELLYCLIHRYYCEAVLHLYMYNETRSMYPSKLSDFPQFLLPDCADFLSGWLTRASRAGLFICNGRRLYCDQGKAFGPVCLNRLLFEKSNSANQELPSAHLHMISKTWFPGLSYSAYHPYFCLIALISKRSQTSLDKVLVNLAFKHQLRLF